MFSLTVAPEVQARLAPALDPANIKEGEDVYFECHIRANPPESRVEWLHQVSAPFTLTASCHHTHTHQDQDPATPATNLYPTNSPTPTHPHRHHRNAPHAFTWRGYALP